MKLYQIANEYEQLLDQTFNDETGEINEVALSQMNELKESVEQKSIALASYIKNIEADRKAIEEAKREMDRREKSLEKKVDYLSQYLQTNMEKCNITEISCAYFKIKLKKCPYSVNVFDEDIISDEYKRSKVVTSVDKLKLKDELLAGVIIAGAELRQNNRLEIK